MTKQAIATWNDSASNRKIRICYIIDKLGVGGTESQLLALLRQIDKTKIQPYLCLLRGKSSASRSLEPEGVPILDLGIHSFRNLRTISGALHLARFLRRERIDAIQTYFPDSTLFGTLVARASGVRFAIRTVLNLGTLRTVRQRMMRRVVEAMAPRALANCAATARVACQNSSASRTRTELLPNGVDFARFHAKQARGPSKGIQRRRIGIVANLRPVKNIEAFIRAASIVHRVQDGVEFVVAGEGRLRPALQDLIHSLGIERHCRLIGDVADPAAFLRTLSVAVICSHSEGSSNALMEYMASGRAVVAAAVGGLPELMTDGVDGMCVAPSSPENLAAAILHLLRRTELARVFGRQAAGKARAHFVQSRRAEIIEAYYQRLLRPGEGR
ncbi:MAG: glycosyltransferase [Gemmataceae bacterium]|nr:glycosyltransferase [Gemmataceae bacterium]